MKWMRSFSHLAIAAVTILLSVPVQYLHADKAVPGFGLQCLRCSSAPYWSLKKQNQKVNCVRRRMFEFHSIPKHEEHIFDNQHETKLKDYEIFIPRSNAFSLTPKSLERRKTSRAKRGRRRRKNAMTEDEAIAVESWLINGLESLQMAVRDSRNSATKLTEQLGDLNFLPSVRECNAAIATFGDSNDFLRGLRLFVKMRKVGSLQKLISKRFGASGSAVLTPTLVTYSTLMSRAIQSGKVHIALRLWRLMKLQSEFFTHYSPDVIESAQQVLNNESSSSFDTTIIIPDTRSANILMNAFAKTGDVGSAQNLLSQMLSSKWSSGSDVPPLTPNLVTYNTLIDACRRAGDLTKGLQMLQDLRSRDIKPDARTYTSLISTVARQRRKDASGSSTSKSSGGPGTTKQLFGSNDPDMAFTLLSEMVNEQHLRPNGITYCALIDVCGRCGRPDLALKGLRMMLLQKKQEEEGTVTDYHDPGGSSRKFSWAKMSTEHREAELGMQVGAWTAAINACGRGGRVSTAIRLFKAMQSAPFDTSPNTVTCGCLTDCLLRAEDHPNRISEILEILKYMKKENLKPTEYMYTSLMTSAGRLVEMESIKTQDETVDDKQSSSVPTKAKSTHAIQGDQNNAKAIDVYTELMEALMLRSKSSSVASTEPDLKDKTIVSESEDTSSVLNKVFLVFNHMKSAGATPDIASYNALLHACARAGDFRRARTVLQWIKLEEEIEPNGYSWLQMIRAAAKTSCTSDLLRENSVPSEESQGGPIAAVEKVWKEAIEYHVLASKQGPANEVWTPNSEAYYELLKAYWNEASASSTTAETRVEILKKIVRSYLIVSDRLSGTNGPAVGTILVEDLGSVDLVHVRQNQKMMLLLLRASVSLHLMGEISRDLAIMLLLESPSLRNLYPVKSSASDPNLKALSLARQWNSEMKADEPRWQNLSLDNTGVIPI